jgi:hypothetical protein
VIAMPDMTMSTPAFNAVKPGKGLVTNSTDIQRVRQVREATSRPMSCPTCSC